MASSILLHVTHVDDSIRGRQGPCVYFWGVICCCPIAFADHAEVKQTLDGMETAGIIAPVKEATDWVASLVVLRKLNGKLRIFIEHTRLNRHVVRPTHPTRKPRDAVAEIVNEAMFCSSFDATNGYFQIPLHTASQHLTTFMTPWGRYKFMRASMGLCSPCDEYIRADAAFGTLQNTVRVVDDILR